jgi:hypothetical protein
MAMRSAAGAEVASTDLLIQIAALLIFGGLLWFDRNAEIEVGDGWRSDSRRSDS